MDSPTDPADPAYPTGPPDPTGPTGRRDPLEGQELELVYPCPWTYTVIGKEESSLRAAVSELLGKRPHGLAFSHESKGGKYVSMHLELEVFDDGDRHGLFHELKRDERIIYVI